MQGDVGMSCMYYMSLNYAIFGSGISAQGARALALSNGFQVVLFGEFGRGGRSIRTALPQ